MHPLPGLQLWSFPYRKEADGNILYADSRRTPGSRCMGRKASVLPIREAPLQKSIGGIVRGLGGFSNLNWMEQTPPGFSPLLHIFPFPLGHLSSLQLPLKANIHIEMAVSCSPVFLLMLDSPLSLSQASMSVLFPMLPDLPPFQLPCSPLSWMGHLSSVSHSEAGLADKWPSARLANCSCSADRGCGPLGSPSLAAPANFPIPK